MSYQDILDEKDKNIVRIDKFIDFLRKNFKELDKYNQLVALLNKEKKLYLKLGEKDSNDFTKELKDIGYQISLKILEIKNNKINVIDEISSEDKKQILEPDKLLDENMHNIKKELYKNFKNIFSCLFDYKESNASRVREFLEEIFFNCDCKGSPQSKIIELLTSIKNNREILKNKKIKKNFNKEVEAEIAKEKFSDKFIKKKKEELLNNEAIKIKNRLLFNKLFEYYLTNFYEQKSIKDHVNALLKFHPLILSGISLISMICYFVYFGLFVGYFPALSGSDVFYFGGLIFFVIAFFSIIIVSPMLLYPEYYKTEKKFKLILAISMPSILIYTYLMLIAGASTKLFVFVTTAIYIITLLLVFGAFKIKDYIFDSILKQIVSIIVIVIIIILLAKIQYYLSNNIVKLMIKLFSISILISFVIPLGFLLYMHEIYQTGEYRLILSGFIVAIQVYFFVTITDNIANNFEIANVKYKYLSIEKSVASALPEKICKNGKNKNCDFNKTYYDENETSGVMKLYNIKALSTLGKFYYLETIGYKNKNDKEIKFELDSSKIISRQKQER